MFLINIKKIVSINFINEYLIVTNFDLLCLIMSYLIYIMQIMTNFVQSLLGFHYNGWIHTITLLGTSY